MRSTVFYKCPNCQTLLNGDAINVQLGNKLSQSLDNNTTVWVMVGATTVVASVVVAAIAALIYLVVGGGLKTIITVAVLVVVGIAVGFYAYLTQ